MWITTGIGTLYPNLYVVLVGPPGVGKTVLTSRVQRILEDLGENGTQFFIAPSSVNHASLINELVEAKRNYINPMTMEPISYNALALVSNELSVLLPEYDTNFISKLTDIWDGFRYGERRRTKDLNFKIDNPMLNLLAATTPAYLTSSIPEIAWDGGFLSRTLLVFSAETLQRDIFGAVPAQEQLYKKLLADLKDVFNHFGELKFTSEAIEAIESWNRAGCPPVPEHPKLLHYNIRRRVQLLKLCMIMSLARGDDLTITIEDYKRAMDALLELEVMLPDIFKAMTSGGDSRVMDECWYFVSLAWAKENGPIHEGRIIAFLSEHLPAHTVVRVFELMVRVGILIEEITPKPGRWYRPKPRKPGT